MKKILIVAALLASMAGAYAQGTIVFDNRSPGSLMTRVYGPQADGSSTVIRGSGSDDVPTSGTTTWTGTRLAGTGYSAQLWAGPANTPEDALTAVPGTVTGFSTSGSSRIQTTGMEVVVPGVANAQVATLQLRAWDNQGGTKTWDNATIRGSSAAFQSLPLGGGTPVVAAPLMIGLTSFNIAPVPEPSTIALGVIGAAAFLARRRKQQ